MRRFRGGVFPSCTAGGAAIGWAVADGPEGGWAFMRWMAGRWMRDFRSLRYCGELTEVMSRRSTFSSDSAADAGLSGGRGAATADAP